MKEQRDMLVSETRLDGLTMPACMYAWIRNLYIII